MVAERDRASFPVFLGELSEGLAFLALVLDLEALLHADWFWTCGGALGGDVDHAVLLTERAKIFEDANQPIRTLVSAKCLVNMQGR